MKGGSSRPAAAGVGGGSVDLRAIDAEIAEFEAELQRAGVDVGRLGQDETSADDVEDLLHDYEQQQQQQQQQQQSHDTMMVS